MENKLNNFDRILKDTVEQYEAPYDPSHWESLEKELNILAPSPVKYFSSLTTGLVAASLVFMAMLMFVSDVNHERLDTRIATVEPADDLNRPNGDESTSTSSASVNKMTTAGDSDEQDNAENEILTESGLAENTVDPGVSESKQFSEKPNKAVKAAANAKEKSKTSIKIESGVRTGCTGLIIDFQATEDYGQDAKYLWNFGDGFFSNEANPSHTFNKSGTFDVSLSVTSYTTGQISSNVVQAMIEVVEAPVANFSVDILSKEMVSVKNNSYRARDVEWIVDGNSKGIFPEIQLSLADNTRYNVALSAISEGGCTDTLSQEITISNEKTSIPGRINFEKTGAFKPSDFVTSGKPVQFKVFDQNNQMVFESSGQQEWTGFDQNRKVVNPGQFNWVMILEKNGDISIVDGTILVE
jgi:PKD repeat protein